MKMSRYRVPDNVDSLLGVSSPRGDLVQASGSGVNQDDEFLLDRTDDVDPCTEHRHGKLKGSKRCFGCGRTRNEVELEEGA
jgi:hypothetical protein